MLPELQILHSSGLPNKVHVMHEVSRSMKDTSSRRHQMKS